MKPITDLVRKNIIALSPYSAARHEFTGAASVFLDANENPFDTGMNRYPDPLQHAVKVKIAAWRGVEVENIFLGNGSDEAIDLLLRIFCEPRQDEIMILPPTYGMYQVSAEIADVGVREVLLSPDFQPQVAEILAAATPKTKILFLCSPNNPTGNSFEAAQLETLLANFGGIVVIDEAYIDFSAHASCVSWLQRYPNLVVLQTFSKAWGAAGLRLGMAFASTEIIALFNKVKPPYNINQLTQAAALQLLEKPEQTQQFIQDILTERRLLIQKIEALPTVTKVFPTDANFILIKINDPNGCYQHLVRQGIIVRNRSNVVLCEGCLRITVGTTAENMKLMDALAQWNV